MVAVQRFNGSEREYEEEKEGDGGAALQTSPYARGMWGRVLAHLSKMLFPTLLCLTLSVNAGCVGYAGISSRQCLSPCFSPCFSSSPLFLFFWW